MKTPIAPVVTSAAERPVEHSATGFVSWHTLISGNITPTDTLTAGLATVPAREGRLELHRHEDPEIYFIVEGTGIMTIDGQDTNVGPGTTIFIPGNAEHGIRNESAADLKFFYVFATDQFPDVVYRYS
ncbi:cupin domain-containing protein [Gluconacetobacter tumulisoli]|uniref:cupin domain-containing protein n=1 Tax=Gluconacetobacter tumulisoli TaxID=1286189 RepID=UPI001C800299